MKLPQYLSWLRLQPCLCCGRRPVNPHHCSSEGTAKRNHDQICVPLCFDCHRAVHDGLAHWASKAGLQRKAQEYFKTWLGTLDESKRKKILKKLEEQK